MGAVTGLTNTVASGAMLAQSKHSENSAKATAMMSTGSRLVKPSDGSSDAAIAAQLGSTVEILKQGRTNAQNLSGLLQVAAGAVTNIRDLLTAKGTLAAKAYSGDLGPDSLSMINNEYQQLKSQIDDIANKTRWNGVSLLNGGSLNTVANAGAVNNGTAGQGIASNLVAGPTNTFGATPFSATVSDGFISGTVSSATVKVSNGGGYDVTVQVGDQTFKAFNEVPADGATLELYSVTDPANIIALTYDADRSGITNATTFQTALQQTLGLNAGATAAQFTSASYALNGGVTAITAGTQTGAGTYMLRMGANSGTLEITNGTQVWQAAVSADGAQSVTFNNGVSVTLDATFARATAINQSVFTVTAGTSVSLTSQIGEKSSTDTLTVKIAALTAEALNVASTDVTNSENAQTAGTRIQQALNAVNNIYATLGAQQKRLESAITNVSTQVQNLTAAKQNYSDADIAQTISDYTIASTMSDVASRGIADGLEMTKKLLKLVERA
ncbi:MAG: flagellin [Holosporales bacterium]